MKRSLKTVLAFLLIAACLSTAALAADPTVTYSGNSGNFVFAPEDLFADFKDVMPGDTRTEQITVKNNANKKVDVKIYMRALGAVEGDEKGEAFLNELKLTVTQSGKADPLFEAPAGETAQLTHWKPLGTFKSGAAVTLNVKLEVPLEMGDGYQDADGQLQWEFRVEEFPVEQPATGDETPLGLYAAVAAVCALGIVVLLLTKKKRKA